MPWHRAFCLVVVDRDGVGGFLHFVFGESAEGGKKYITNCDKRQFAATIILSVAKNLARTFCARI